MNPKIIEGIKLLEQAYQEIFDIAKKDNPEAGIYFIPDEPLLHAIRHLKSITGIE